MTDAFRVSVLACRERGHLQPWFADRVLALLDVAEAAHRLSDHIQRGREPAGSLASVERWSAETEPLEDALAVALTQATLSPPESDPSSRVSSTENGETP